MPFSTYLVRLVGSSLSHAGFVQIRYFGRWGSFCQWLSWGLTQGHVVCKELGYRRALFATFGSLFEQQSGPFWVKEALCTGNESSILHCKLKYVCNTDEVWEDCVYHNRSNWVICESKKESGLNETAAVRLKGSNFSHMGRVEIKQHGFWHAVCSIGWDKHDADVVCRQLGFTQAVVEVGHGQFGSSLALSGSTPQEATTKKQGSDPGPMWLTSVRCQGNETSLDQCVSAGWELEADCEKTYGAGVICKMDNITDDGEVRLRGSSKKNKGRVEVKIGGIWGTVAQKDWDIRDGHVVCRQLGYRQAVRVNWYQWLNHNGNAKNIWLSNLHCTGEEKNILDCPRELNFYRRRDDRSGNVGVECTNSTSNTSELEMFEVRLDGMKRPNIGNVQIKYHGTWGVLCATWWPSWYWSAAQVICRQLRQGPPLKHNFLSKECPATIQGTKAVWIPEIICGGFEDSIDQCTHRMSGRLDPEGCIFCKQCLLCLRCQPFGANSTTTGVSILSTSPTVTFAIPRASSETASPATSLTKAPNTRQFVPTQTSSTKGPLSTSAPSTSGPPINCPSTRCQNGGSCEWLNNSWKCLCLEKFAGEYCEVFVGSDTVSIVLKMTSDRWNSLEFKTTLAEILTSYCRLSPCLAEKTTTGRKSQKKSPSFLPDDVIILQGYPVALEGTPLLNLRLAIKSDNKVIPHGVLNHLLFEVAPEIKRLLGHGVVYIGRMEFDSGQAASVPPKASGRNSDEPDSVTSHKYALIALGVLLGVVCLVAIVIIVFYRRKIKRKKTSLNHDELEQKSGENISLMPL
ncbi:hypothetical protein ACROYT_G041758 [Oculina patagonica]